MPKLGINPLSFSVLISAGIADYLKNYTPDPNEPTTTEPPPQAGEQFCLLLSKLNCSCIEAVACGLTLGMQSGIKFSFVIFLL